MPTYWELPESELRGPRRPRRPLSRLIVALILIACVAGGFLVASRVAPNSTTTAAGSTAVSPTDERAQTAASVPTVPAVAVGQPDTTITLARSLTLPGAGSPPDLVVTATHTVMTIHSRSQEPVSVEDNSSYGEPLHPWMVFRAGGGLHRMVQTGVEYAYCFSQAAGDGFADAHACGAVTLHSYVDGVRAPDGSVIPLTIGFVRP
jgi:hypothetical protein